MNCKGCEIEIIGRKDKKFCSDKCRNMYNYSPEKYNKNKNKYLQAIKHYRLMNPEKYLLTDIKSKCKRKQIDFDLELSDIKIPAVCPLLSIPLFFSEKVTNNTPSLDRINNELGYVKGNVWIISWKANRCKSDLTIDQINSFCRKLLSVVSELK